MVCHNCPVCGLEFNKKSRLIEHTNKKFKCKPIINIENNIGSINEIKNPIVFQNISNILNEQFGQQIHNENNNGLVNFKIDRINNSRNNSNRSE